MINLLWEEIEIRDMEFKGIKNAIEVENDIVTQFDKWFDETYPNGENLMSDFEFKTDEDKEVELFTEEDGVTLRLHFELNIVDNNIKGCEDITEEWLSPVVRDIENGLICSIRKALSLKSFAGSIAFIKAYYEEAQDEDN